MQRRFLNNFVVAGATAALALGGVACEVDDAPDPGIEEDPGLEDDGLEDDGLDDDGLDDDGMDDDGLDDDGEDGDI